MPNIPADLNYSSSHEWLRLEGEDVAIVGITDYAQSELGDIVYVDLPTVGKVIKTGDSLASVESVKTVSDVYSPVDGEVIEVNEALGAQSELINSDPYGRGYLVKLRMSAPYEVDVMMDADEYAASLA